MSASWQRCSHCGFNYQHAGSDGGCPGCGKGKKAVSTSPSIARWSLACGKQKLGPFALAELRGLVVVGKLQSTDMLLPEYTNKWVAAGFVTGLFPHVATTPPVVVTAQVQPVSNTSKKRNSFWGEVVKLGGKAILIAILIASVPPAIWFGMGLLIALTSQHKEDPKEVVLPSHPAATNVAAPTNNLPPIEIDPQLDSFMTFSNWRRDRSFVTVHITAKERLDPNHHSLVMDCYDAAGVRIGEATISVNSTIFAGQTVEVEAVLDSEKLDRTARIKVVSKKNV